ncbi:MAG: hypothetical protein JXR58_08620, partial [Bacteroidales bacterium]|nr:hypothetical protein [Bacteroidales bacterium]
MDPFRVIFLLVLVSSPILLLAYSTELIKNRSLSKNNTKWLAFLRYKIVIGITIITGTSLILVNLVFSEPVFDNPEKKIEHARKRNLPDLLTEGYKELIEKDSTNLDYHYNYVLSHFQQKTSYKNAKGELIF